MDLFEVRFFFNEVYDYYCYFNKFIYVLFYFNKSLSILMSIFFYLYEKNIFKNIN